jgi:serine/threonine-protein kinase RsbW
VTEPATISLELDSRRDSVTLVRGMLAGVSEQLPLDAELLDDLKTAVSEACNNVVMHAYDDGPGPLIVHLTATDDGVEVVVRDRGRGIQQILPTEDRMGVGLAVISALADRAEFLTASGGGTEVRMAFRRRDARDEPSQQTETAPPVAAPALDGLTQELSGDVVVTLSPVSLMPGVLGRVARAAAAGARFSLDRFSDVYLVTDAVAALVGDAASGDRTGFALSSEERRLELTFGPLRAGSSAPLQHDQDSSEPTSPVAVLVDEISVSAQGRLELLHVVMCDRSRDGEETD